jgi:hypothetical protein
VVTHQADGVALGVLHKGHPLLHAGGPQTVVGMAEDDVRLSNDLHSIGAQRFDRRPHVIDLQVDQRACCCLLEQQANCTCSEEQQARRIEEAGRFGVEQALVEGPRALQVIGVLCDLNDLHWLSFARLRPVVGGSR